MADAVQTAAADVSQAAPVCLGLVATCDAAAPHLLGLARAAMARAGQLQLEVCEHAWQMFGGGPAPDGFKLRSQLQNAMLARDCDRVIVI